MKNTLVIALIALTVSSYVQSRPTAADFPTTGPQQWQLGKTYKYQIEGRTLASLPQIEKQYTGLHLSTMMTIHPITTERLYVKFDYFNFGKINHKLEQGVDGNIPKDLEYKPAPQMQQPFELTMSNGRIVSVQVPAQMSLKDENLLKGLVGWLQVDMSGDSLIPNTYNYLNREAGQGVYRTMETDVTGKCEVLYSVSPLTQESFQIDPELAPNAFPLPSEEFFRVTKSKNYNKCSKRVAYHFGVPEDAEWRRPGRTENSFLHSSTVSEIVMNKKNNTIYSAEVKSNVASSPSLYDDNKASVMSRVRAVLFEITDESATQYDSKSATRDAGSLLYRLSADKITQESTLSDENNESGEQKLKKNEKKDKKRPKRSAKDDEDDASQTKKSKQSKKLKNNKIDKKVKQTYYESDDSSSNQYDSYENIPQMHEASTSSIYMIDEDKIPEHYTPATIQKLAYEIGTDMQNYNDLPKLDVLSKFNILARVISTMTTSQLQAVSKIMEREQNSEDDTKSDAWRVYRDAVAQAGSSPAFQQIKLWIKTYKLQGEEAAGVVSTLPETLRYPTEENLSGFFKLAMNPEVRKQSTLNSTILLAATRFAHYALVNNDTARSYYPTYTYGRFTPEHYTIVRDYIMPTLKKELTSALKRDDSIQAQVYIQALGNLGHASIIEAFGPIIEGKIPASKYLRTFAVISLHHYAQLYPHQARTILYNIYKNTAEDYEVRVAAVFNLMKAHPTPAMLQEMAADSQQETSKQVARAIKTSIQAAAQSEKRTHWGLRHAAQSALHLLSNKEKNGLQYSSTYFDSEELEYMNAGYFREFYSIGSQDSLLPKYTEYAWGSKRSGWLRPDRIGAYVSNVGSIIDMYNVHMRQQQGQQPNQQENEQQPRDLYNVNEKLEGSLYFNIMNQERMYPFNEDSMKQLSEAMKPYVDAVRNGQYKTHHTKIYNSVDTKVMFPLAMGMPYVYYYKEPTYVHYKVQFTGPNEAEIKMTYAKNQDGVSGFYDTLNEQFTTAGVVSKFQMNVPLKISFGLENWRLNVKIQPLNQNQEESLVHYSVWPYVGQQPLHSITPISQDPSSKVLTPRYREEQSIDTEMGQQETGMTFRVQGHSYSDDYRSISNVFKGRSVYAKLNTLLQQADIQRTSFNLKYIGQKSTVKSISMSFAFDRKQGQASGVNEQNENEQPETYEQQDNTYDGNKRRTDMLNYVLQSAPHSFAYVYDASIKFEGANYLANYIATLAHAGSQADSKTKAYLYIRANNPDQEYQINLSAIYNQNNPPELNFKKAIENQPSSNYEIKVKYGKPGNEAEIKVQGKINRTNEKKEALLNQSVSGHPQKCYREMEDKNKNMKDCRKAVYLANTPDLIEAQVEYKNINENTKLIANKAYNYIHAFAHWFITEQGQFENNDANDGKFVMRFRFSPDSRTVDLSFLMGDYKMLLNNLAVPPYVRPIVVPHSSKSIVQRLGHYWYQEQYQGTCVSDLNGVMTFDRRTYSYEMNQQWHVLMRSQNSRPWQYQNKLVVMARKPNPQHQEVNIEYTAYNGETVKVKLQPSATPESSATGANPSAFIEIQGEQRKLNDQQIEQYGKQQAIVIAYTLPSGEIIAEFENNLKAIYDGETLKLRVSDQYRNATRGLCGDFSGEESDDFKTQQDKFIPNSQEFASWYKLDQNNQMYQEQQMKNQNYQPRQMKYTSISGNNIASDVLSSKYKSDSMESNESSNEFLLMKTKSFKPEVGPCKKQVQVQFYEKNGQICISNKLLAACSVKCTGISFKIAPAQVTCKPASDPEFRQMKEQIMSGESPTVPSGDKQYQVQFRVPTSCKA